MRKRRSRKRPPARGAILGTLFRGRVFDVVREPVRGGSRGRSSLEIVRHPGAAVIVARPDPGSVLLVRQWRPAVGARLWEIPAGRIEGKESPADCAARELEEETGLRARRMTPIGRFYPAPGYTSECMHLFLAEGLAKARGGRLAPDPDERIEVRSVSLDRVRDWIRRGRVLDGKTIVGIALAFGLRARVTQWRRRGALAFPGPG